MTRFRSQFATPRATLRATLVALSLAALPLAAPSAGAQQTRSPEERLTGRVDDRTRAMVLAQVDSAHREGLPTDRLITRALEGASKRAPSPMIVSEVRRLRLSLSTARGVLGMRTTAAELETAASALQARVNSDVLASLRRARPDAPLTVPLAVLTDLVAIGVPVDTAARAVLALALVDDARLLAYQRDVERDVSVGALPGVAATLRAAGVAGAVAEGLYSGSIPNAAPAGGVPAGAATRSPPRKP